MADKSFLDWPFFEDSHRRLAAELDEWTASEIAPLEAKPHSGIEEVDALCREMVRRLAAGGWLKYVVPAEYGGVTETLDVRSLCLIREILARTSGLADFAFAMQGLGSGTISLYGDDALKQATLPGVVDGSRIAAFALTEPDAGSDVAAIAMTAEDAGDHYLLNGEKTFISNGGIADHYVTFARTGEAPGAKGLSAFLVEAGTEGLEIAERIEVMAPHPLARLVYKDCRVPKSHLLGNPGAGFKAAMATLDIFRSTVGAAALGFSRRALDEALSRARDRKLFGAPLGDLQLVQAQLAEMAVDIDASALLIYRAGWTKDKTGGRITREAAMAKLYATDSAQQTIDKALQIFGGLGVVTGMPVEKFYREVRALRIYEGASEVQKIIIARQLLRG